MTPGARIKQLRKDKGLTQAQLASQLDISRSYMSEIESDKRNMSVTTIQKFAKKLNVSASELIDPITLVDSEDTSLFENAPTHFKNNLVKMLTEFTDQSEKNDLSYINNFLTQISNEKNNFSNLSITTLASLIRYIYINEPAKKNDDVVNIRFMNHIIETISNYQNGNDEGLDKEDIIKNLNTFIDALL